MTIKIKYKGLIYTASVTELQLHFPIVYIQELEKSFNFSQTAIKKALAGDILEA